LTERSERVTITATHTLLKPKPLLIADKPAARSRSGALLIFTLFLGVFFLSGAGSLVYQVVWTRMLSLVFGVTIYAISVVLASFMGGLALGSFAAGKLADRVERPLVCYAVCEIAVGLLGVASLWAIKEITPLYVTLYNATGESAALATFTRWLLASAVLVAPTTLMGATLPFIVKASLEHFLNLGENVSLLYAVNTAGAALGTVVTGFVLVGNLGFQASVFIAATMNISAGGLAFALVALSGRPALKGTGSLSSVDHQRLSRPPLPPGLTTIVLASMAVSGFCALAYEVIWFRILDLILNGTAYAFSIMLGTFLVGLSVGSTLSRIIMPQTRNWVAVLGVLESMIGAQALLAILAVGRLPDLRDALVSLPGLSIMLDGPVFAMAFAVVLVLLPLTILLGTTFPVAAQAIGQGREKVGELIGRLNAVNTFGAILGSLVAGFWLIPVFGSQHALTVLAIVNLGTGYVLLWEVLRRHAAYKLAFPVAALILAFPGLTSEMVRDLYKGIFKQHQLLWYEEGLESTVSVHKHDLGYTALYINNRGQASDSPAAVRFHQLLGHLPMLLHPDPKEALVIGLGGGATPGALSQYRDTSTSVVELSHGIVRAASYFEGINNMVLKQPNVRVVVDDGRNHLLVSGKKYDIITADIIQAHHAGAGNLYSTEYFELAKAALKDDGIMMQWAERGNTLLYPLVVRTFLRVFPNTTFWCEGSLMVGTTSPQNWTLQQIEQRFAKPGIADIAQRVGMGSARDLLSHYSGDATKFKDYVGDGPILTDDRPLTEYFQAAPHITLKSIQWSSPGRQDNNCPFVFR